MAKSTFLSIGALLFAAVPAVASAQHVSPANTAFIATGPAAITASGTSNLTCTLTITGTTGPNIGGAHAGHATGGTITSGQFTGPGPCPSLSMNVAINPSFGMSGSGTGDFNAIELGICGPSSGTTVPFVITNTSATTSVIDISSAIGICFMDASLDADFIDVP